MLCMMLRKSGWAMIIESAMAIETRSGKNNQEKDTISLCRVTMNMLLMLVAASRSKMKAELGAF